MHVDFVAVLGLAGAFGGRSDLDIKGLVEGDGGERGQNESEEAAAHVDGDLGGSGGRLELVDGNRAVEEDDCGECRVYVSFLTLHSTT